MATKYVVIPEDMYKSLVKEQKEKNVQIGVEQAKNEVEKVKNSRRKNISEKNVLYNQELRRYLKTAKEEAEKPIKVQLSNGQKAVVKKDQEIQTAKTASRPPSGTYFEEEEESGDFIPGDKYKFTPKTPLAYGNYKFDPKTSTPKFFKKNNVSFPANYQDAKDTKDLPVQKLLLIINADPFKFGVSQHGKIMNNLSQPIDESDLMASLEYIVKGGRGKKEQAPVGTIYLENKLKLNPVTKNIIFSNYHQSGKGSIKKPQNLKKVHKTAFKPMLWSKN